MSLFRVSFVLALSLVLGGCFSIRDTQTISATTPALDLAKTAAGQKVQEFQKKKEKNSSSEQQLPELLGGVVSSDRWVVYKEKQEEEFEGNVRYDNGIYLFKSDYALSQRKQNAITAKGSIRIRKKEPSGAYYEVYAEQLFYNYKTGQATIQAAKGKRITLVYKNEQGDLITALARKAVINTKKQTALLTGKVLVIHVDKLGKKATLNADQISADKLANHAVLQGNAVAKNEDYSVKSDRIEYDGPSQMAYAYGNRPLATGKTEDGTFAIIADKVSAETDTRKINLSGQVQGWVISDQINSSQANKTF